MSTTTQWKKGFLYEIATVVGGYAFRGEDFGSEGTAVIKIKDIQPPYVDIQNAERIDQQKYNQQKIEKFKLSKGDCLVAMTGATIGKVGKISYDEVSYLNQRVAKVAEKRGVADKNFVYYAVLGSDFQRYVNTTSSGSSAQQNISADDIGRFPIVYPIDIKDQCTIAQVLISLDKKIELLRKQNETLEEMARAIFNAWFVEFNFPDKDGKPYKASGGKMVDSEFGEIPEEWRVGTLAELIDQLSERIGSDEQSKYTVMSAVNTGQLVPSSEYFTKQVFSKSISKYIKIHQGDFAYNPARINIGSIGRLRELILGAVSPVYVAFRAKEGAGAFVDFLIQTAKMKKHIELYANGSVRQTLDYDGFGAFSFAVPTENILKEFDKITASLRNIFERKEAQIENLRTVRDLLLPKLMSGEVRVNT
ncbi:MAG: restriction endonuclease subunit S [Candidatus Pacebacteria bacterium]|nr:restriction endonuclease subunit S [Candidatus Paceibacterota bacterium]